MPPSDYESVRLHYDVPQGWPVYCSSIQADERTCALDLNGDPNNIYALQSHMTPVGH